ncbi:CLUMA_CG011203, isoform A [Clunio marinus]|uniref:CLUMA_CG011203, isoform A n=1 Tax=Clunio marinus TaxID=568069 RepID=A0A1J1IC98_9DIPT|nr:CLUMA_CG011203, isoform A [Clunio marinus]
MPENRKRLEKDIDSAIVHRCIELKFPRDSILNPEYVRKIDRSRQMPLFRNFIERVYSKDKVSCIRNNLLIHSCKKDNQTRHNTKNDPAQLKLLSEARVLKKHIEIAAQKHDGLKQIEKKLIKQLKDRDNESEKIPTIKKVEMKNVRTSILEAKLSTMQDQLEKGKKLNLDLNKLFMKQPLPRTFAQMDTNLNDTNNKEIDKSLESIEFFYESSRRGENISPNALWNDVTKSLGVIPNYNIFERIIKKMEHQCSVLSNNTSLASLDNNSKFPSLANDEHLLLDLKHHLINEGVEANIKKKDIEKINAICVESINKEVDKLQSLSISFDESLECDGGGIKGEFITLKVRLFLIEGKIKFANESVEKLNQKLEGAKDLPITYKIAIEENQTAREIIGCKINKIQQSIAQMHQIKEAITALRLSMRYAIQREKKMNTRQNNIHTMLNLKRSENAYTPKHHDELQRFLDIPFEKFSSKNEIIFNPFNYNFDFDDKADKLLPMRFQNFKFLLNSLREFFHFMQKVKQINGKILFETPNELVFDSFHDKLMMNREAIAEFLDEIVKINVTVNSSLRDLNYLTDYTIQNPLKKFVPSRKVDGKTFKETEEEFKLYYNMFKNDQL